MIQKHQRQSRRCTIISWICPSNRERSFDYSSRIRSLPYNICCFTYSVIFSNFISRSISIVSCLLVLLTKYGSSSPISRNSSTSSPISRHNSLTGKCTSCLCFFYSSLIDEITRFIERTTCPISRDSNTSFQCPLTHLFRYSCTSRLDFSGIILPCKDTTTIKLSLSA